MKPRMSKERGWWIVRGVLQDKGLVGVICIGRGRQMQTAWNDYSRKYNWFKRGCPGFRLIKTTEIPRGKENDHEGVRKVRDGQESGRTRA